MHITSGGLSQLVFRMIVFNGVRTSKDGQMMIESSYNYFLASCFVVPELSDVGSYFPVLRHHFHRPYDIYPSPLR